MAGGIIALALAAPTCAYGFGQLRQWGEDGSGPGQLGSPSGVAIGTDGSVYVLDPYNQRVVRFDASGGFLSQWGEAGSEDGNVLFPKGIATDIDGNVLVADTENSRLERFAPSGVFARSIGAAYLDHPFGVDVTPSGNIVVADRNHNRVAVFGSEGRLVRTWGDSGPVTLSRPHSVAADEDSIYVTDSHALRKFTASGELQWERLDTGYDAGLALDPAGNLYAGRAGIDARVDEFAPNGALTGSFGSYGSGPQQFQSPYGLSVDCHFNIYVADEETHRVIKWGGTPEEFPPCANAPTQPPPQSEPPPPPASIAPPPESPTRPALRVVLRAKSPQRLGKRRIILLTAGCNRACSITVRGHAVVRRLPMNIRSSRRLVPAGVMAAFRLTISKRVAARLRSPGAAARRALVKLTATATARSEKPVHTRGALLIH